MMPTGMLAPFLRASVAKPAGATGRPGAAGDSAWAGLETLEPRLLLSSSLPTVTITATDARASETLGGARPNGALFTVTRTGPITCTTPELTVSFNLLGTATPGADYEDPGLDVTIPAGKASVQIPIVVLDDDEAEPAESVIAALAPSPDYLLSPTAAKQFATATIADNEPTVSIAASDARAAETLDGAKADGGLFTITRSGTITPATPELTVNLCIVGTALNGTDYAMIGDSATIPQGQASVKIPVTVIDDSLPEPKETVVVQLAEGPTYHLSARLSRNVGVATITDNDLPTVGITAMDEEAARFGAAAPDLGTVRISRTGSTAAALAVSFARSGTAVFSKDYTLKVGTKALAGTSVTIPAGQWFVDITIWPVATSAATSDQTAILTLQPGRTYTLETPIQAPAPAGMLAQTAGYPFPNALVNILNEPQGSPWISLSPPVPAAWPVDGASHDAVLTLSGGQGPYQWDVQNLPPGFSLTPDGATATLSGTAPDLAPGTVQAITPPITITVTDSSDPPLVHTVTMRLTYVLPPPQITTAQLDDATELAPYTFTLLAQGGVPEYYWYNSAIDGGFRPFWLSVGLDGVISGTPPAGSGGTTGKIYPFGVCVVDSTGHFATRQVRLRVLPAPTITITDVKQAEGNSDITPFVFTVTLSKPGTIPISVNYLTVAGTAAEFVDYGPGADTLTFEPGETQKTITVSVAGDPDIEPDETFFVNLVGPVGAKLVRSKGTGTIVNDDKPLGRYQVRVTVIGNGYVTDTLGKIDTRTGRNVGQYTAYDYPFLVASSPFVEWQGIDWIGQSPALVPQDFANGLDVVAIFF